VRTTVSIDDLLLAEAKVVAARSGRSLGEVIDDALRLLLSPEPDRRRREPVALPVYGGSGLRPGVDLEDKESLAELLEEAAADRAAG
jgi:hypothetical protein